MPARPYAERAPILGGGYLYLPFEPRFVDGLKGAVPADYRDWDADTRSWYVGPEYWEHALALARRFWPTLQIVGTSSEHARQRERQRAGSYRQSREHTRQGFEDIFSQFFGQQPGGQRSAAAPRTDHGVLCVTDDAPPEVIRAAYKALSRLRHPDAGGSTEEMQRINAAFDRLRKAGKA